MKKVLLCLAVQLLLGCSCIAAAPAAAPEVASYPLILEYHHISPVARQELDISLENFQKELDYLQAEGYRSLSLAKFISYLDQHKPFPPKTMLITFDDGYQSIYTYAMPELRKRYMHATFFLVTDSLGKKDKLYPRVTGEQVQKMGHDYLVDVASHTVSHAWLSKLSAPQLQDELIRSKAAVTKLTGKPCLALSYPYGDFNAQVIAATKAAGYQVAFAGYDDNIAQNLKRYTLPRIFMGRYMETNNFKEFKHTFNL